MNANSWEEGMWGYEEAFMDNMHIIKRIRIRVSIILECAFIAYNDNVLFAPANISIESSNFCRFNKIPQQQKTSSVMLMDIF